MYSKPSDFNVRLAAADVSKSSILMAPAGSGKTSVFELRFIRALQTCASPEQVLGVTFTIAAAGEIRERVLGTLRNVADGVQPNNAHEILLFDAAAEVFRLDNMLGWGLIQNPGRLRIMTIDALNFLIASSLPLVSRAGGAPTVDDQPHLLYREAVVNLFSDLEDPQAPSNVKSALETLLAFGRHQLDRLIPMFENLLQARDQWLHPLLSSDLQHFEKTLADIVMSSVEIPGQAMSPTQWRELFSILREASVYSEGLAWAAEIPDGVVLSDLPASMIREIAGVLVTNDGKLRKRVNRSNGFPAGKSATDRMNQFLKELALSGPSEWAGAMGSLTVLPDSSFDEEGKQTLEALAIVLIRLASHLQVVFQNNGAFDFVEVHGRAMQALNTDAEFHSEFLIKEERIKHILVDEMQDTSGAQIRLLVRLMSNWNDSDENSIFLCGDPQQSIYGFRGAEVGQFLEIWLAGKLGPKTLHCLSLTNNFRSSPVLVNFFNEVFAEIFGNEVNRWTGQVPFSNAQAFRTDKPGQINVVPFNTNQGDDEEARLVCDYLERELKQDPGAEIAVLVRARSHLKSLLPMMRSRGIPASGEDIDHLTEKPNVADCVALIRAMAHQGDRTAWTTLLRSPLVGLKWADCVKLIGSDRVRSVRALLDDNELLIGLSTDGKKRVFRLLATLRRIEASERFRDIVWRSRCLWHSLGGQDVVDAHTYNEIRRVFQVLASCCNAGHLDSLTRFEHRLSKLFAAPVEGSVKVMTVHNAKGLEFDKVCLIGMNKRTPSNERSLLYWKCIGDDFLLVPAALRPTKHLAMLNAFMELQNAEAEANEVKRLLYVALTRAESQLTLFCGVSVSSEEKITAGKSTFMRLLLPFVEESLDSVKYMPAANDSERVGRINKIARLPANYRGPVLESPLTIIRKSGQLPAESIIGVGQINDRASIAQRSAGIAFHYFMERIAKEGLAHWPVERVKASQRALIALARRTGCPDKDLPVVVPRVLKWVCDTITSKTGQWLLKERPQRWVEYKVSGQREGRWFSDIMDLVFVENGAIWIVDYKSTFQEGVTADQLLRRYIKQLERYEKTLQARYPGMPIVSAVYDPETVRLATAYDLQSAA